MREIKFRAYDTHTKTMLPVVDIIKFTKIEDVNILRTGAYGVSVCVPFQSSIKLMQYTGLKDKNGNEIYEGDILRIEKEDYKYIVKFYDSCFLGVNKYDEHYEQTKILGNLFALEREVIGNIYENSELLKE